jgi:hypothetical protein
MVLVLQVSEKRLEILGGGLWNVRKRVINIHVFSVAEESLRRCRRCHAERIVHSLNNSGIAAASLQEQKR